MQYTEEQIARANHTDLVSFLNEQGEQLVKSGREYRWKKHDSVTVSGNRKSGDGARQDFCLPSPSSSINIFTASGNVA